MEFAFLYPTEDREDKDYFLLYAVYNFTPRTFLDPKLILQNCICQFAFNQN